MKVPVTRMQLLTLVVNCRRDDGFHHLKVGDDSLVGQWRFCSLHRDYQFPSNFVFYVSQGLIPYDGPGCSLGESSTTLPKPFFDSRRRPETDSIIDR